VKTKRPLIGIVDDDVAVRIALGRFCNAHELRTHAFACAQHLFDSISSAPTPDCLVLDIQMPDFSGIEVQKWLLRRALHIPVIILTGHEDEGTRAESLALGARDFLNKPMDPHALLHAINDALFATTNVQWWGAAGEVRLAAQM
jgi:FixJ family two-component response regulator